MLVPIVLIGLMLPFAFSTIPEAHAIRVQEYFTCKFVDSTGRWEKKTSQFEPTDVAVYCWIQLADCIIGTTYYVRVAWRNPNNEVYTTSEGQITANQNTIPVWANMAILGRAPEKQPGQWAAEFYYAWAGGSWTFGFKTEFTIGRIAPPITTFAVTVDVNQKKVPVIVDGATYGEGSMPKTFTWDKDSSHTLVAKDKFSDKEGVQYVFVSWSDGITSPSRTITVTGSMTLAANYKVQYYLTVQSEQGDPSGEGWYDEGSNAYANVGVDKVPADFFSDYVLKGWSGDAQGSRPKSNTIRMDGPKTARAVWEKQFSMNLYIVITAIVAVIGATIGFLKFKPSSGKKMIAEAPAAGKRPAPV
jgi:hypothetical protein